MSQAHKFGQPHIFCVVKVEQHEVGRTRQLKLAPNLVWEDPEERFRVAMEDITREKLAPTPEVTTTSATDKDTSGAKISLDMAMDAAASTAAAADACDNGSAAPLPLLVTPTPTPPQPQQQQPQQQVVAAAASSLTVSVWSKGPRFGGQQSLLVGTATVPVLCIDHPPGDIWLPITVANTTTSGDGDEKDKKDRKAGGGGGVEDAAAGHGTVAEHPYPDASAAAISRSTTTAAGGNGNRGGNKSWGSGLFKRGKKAPRRQGSRSIEPTQPKEAVDVGSVHVWLGKVRRGSSSGLRPGKGHVILRVHSASGLRKVCTRLLDTTRCMCVDTE